MKNIVTVQDGTEYIYPKDASPLLSSGEAVLLDIRTEYEFSYKRFEAKETVFIPFEEFTVELIKQYKGKLIIIADSFGLESKKLYPVLKENNFNVLCLACGMHDWERDGMPIIVSKDFQLSGSCRCQLKPKRMGPKNK
ncbi:MAG: Rhodanese domain protein [Bacteroidetes bacterium]|nr:Rhodanese domain protein [Bacteroidota bacterium]